MAPLSKSSWYGWRRDQPDARDRLYAAIARPPKRLPGRVDALISRAEAGKLAVSSPRTEFAVRQVEKSVSRLVFAVICGALLIAGALVRPDDATLGNVLMIASAVPGLVAVWGRRR